MSNEIDGNASDAKFEKLETGRFFPLDRSPGISLQNQPSEIYPERYTFLNISPPKMSGNVEHATAIETDPTIFMTRLFS